MHNTLLLLINCAFNLKKQYNVSHYNILLIIEPGLEDDVCDVDITVVIFTVVCVIDELIMTCAAEFK